MTACLCAPEESQIDPFGECLIVEAMTGKDEALTFNAQEQLSAGLSVVLRYASAAYLVCTQQTRPLSLPSSLPAWINLLTCSHRACNDTSKRA